MKYKKQTKMKNKEVITKEHKYFPELLNKLSDNIDKKGGCDGSFNALRSAFDTLENIFGIEINVTETINYMESNGGYCDCEILLNVQYSQPKKAQNIKLR